MKMTFKEFAEKIPCLSRFPASDPPGEFFIFYQVPFIISIAFSACRLTELSSSLRARERTGKALLHFIQPNLFAAM
jgi:hypothetical protein